MVDRMNVSYDISIEARKNQSSYSSHIRTRIPWWTRLLSSQTHHYEYMWWMTKRNHQRNIQSILNLLHWIQLVGYMLWSSTKEKEFPITKFANSKKSSYEYFLFASAYLYFTYHQHISLLFHITKPSSFFKPGPYTSTSKPDPEKKNLFIE